MMRGMNAPEWYELRVAGSAGTREASLAGAQDGIAVGDNGRLCSLSSGCARRFESREQAYDYLGKIKVSGEYHFEAVACGASTDA
jgi:hypothetical protein